ncbi:MAG TPA: class I SAM-dependent methyltransferase [bacterium]|nr:class I SAM-dependent methyltransferase [bacterium]
MTPKDHFSGQAGDYARHRPRYPESLLGFVASQARRKGRAWDCATGSGQCAVALAEHFENVIATDLSPSQLAHAEKHPRVTYRAATAEDSGVETSSVDAVTVAQAFHWFDFEKFYAEVRRVVRPGAVIALWCYGLHTIEPQTHPEIDRICRKFYDDIVGPYWPAEVKWVRERYRTIPFPFEEVEAPSFRIEQEWTLSRVIGNFVSWSSTQYYRKDRGSDPIELIRADLEKAWGDPEAAKKVSWDLYLRVGRVSSSG